MIEKLLRLLMRFIILVAIQVIVLDNIRLAGYINPYLYVLFLLVLPIETPKWLLMLVAFVLGLCVDMFNNTAGMHAAACVAVAFVRPGLLRIMAPRDGYEPERPPGMQFMGFGWFITYAALLVFLHHFVLLYLEIFRLSEFFSTLMRVILSSTLTLVLILLSEFFFFKTKAAK